MERVDVWACLIFFLACVPIRAQQSPSSASNSVVPPLVKFNGVLKDLNGKPLTGVVGVTFSLYKDQEGGAPLWIETQNVEPDKSGRYKVMLGSTSSSGLPSEIFVTGEARWLGVEVQGQSEQARVLLLSVPYALKAGDAATVGGLPPSAFVLAAPPGSNSSTTEAPANTAASAAASVSGGGTTDFIPLWTNSTTLGNSVLFQSGTGSTAKVGIDTTTPASTLDVNGSETIRGSLNLPATGTATATGGKNSQPLDQTASAFNSSTNKAVSQTFQWQAEPVLNNTVTPGGTLNLLFGSGTGSPTETGLKIGSNGQIAFAAGQTFPGAGTITGVSAGTDLTGGGSGGNVTINLDTTKVPQLNSANTFSGNQSVIGNLSASGAGFLGGGLSVQGNLTGQTGVFSGGSAGAILQATQKSTGNAISALSEGGSGIFTQGATAGIVASSLVPGAPAGIFGGAVQIGSPILGGHQTEISGSNQFLLALESPFAGIGPGLDFDYSDSKAMAWEIVATGKQAGQGAGKLIFDDVQHSNNSLLTLDSNTDNVGINNLAPIERLDVSGRVRSQNLVKTVTANNISFSSCNPGSRCPFTTMPNMSLPINTGNVPVLILGQVGGINMTDCSVTNIDLFVDRSSVDHHGIQTGDIASGGRTTVSTTLMSIQSLTPGSHTIEIDWNTDATACGGLGAESEASFFGSTRSLTVVELAGTQQ